jgi:Na+/proline symporter
MVENAYKITLAAAVTPLAFGLYWKKATTQGAVAAMIGGLGTWIALEMIAPEAFLPPQFAGLLASVAGMVLGSLLPQWHAHRASHTRHAQRSVRVKA